MTPLRLCLLFGVLTMLASCGPQRVYQPLPTTEDQSEDLGLKLYKAQACSNCHGEDGLRDPLEKAVGNLGASTLNEDAVFVVLRDGRGQMPAYGNMTETERWALVAYILGLRP